MNPSKKWIVVLAVIVFNLPLTAWATFPFFVNNTMLDMPNIYGDQPVVLILSEPDQYGLKICTYPQNYFYSGSLS